jgi:hypothetical protein
MAEATFTAVLDDGSDLVINLRNIAYIRFIPATIGGTPHAEIFFVGSESPLGVGENVAKQLRKALLT